MQAPGSLNLVMFQGASWDYQLTWTTTAGTVTAPVDLTNYSARMQVRDSYDSSDILLSLTSGTGITLGGTAGTIYLESSAATTAGITDGKFVYDLELVSQAGYVTRLVEGQMHVKPEVTR